ncbi:MAG: 23S rRNA (guanosine(2251)-2'-O)-methyltransferase RlmB [Candidatus Izemoplasmataceae bacterium]
MAILIYGKNPVLEAINAKRKVYELYVLDTLKDEWIKDLEKENIKIKRLNKQKMNQMFSTTHQGLGALVEDYKTISLEDALAKEDKKLFIMLDSVEDPHNLGAIIRSADAFHASGVIIPKHRSVQITPTVVKVSTGAIEYVDVISVTNLNQAIKTLKAHNVWVVGTDLETEQGLESIHADTDLCIVLGSEGKGLSRLIKDNCDYLVKIPMKGHVNSLNVSVSCGILLHDIIRRRG